MVNTLSQLRTDVAEALKADGLKAIEYVSETFTPPVCIVLPDTPYVTAPEGSNPFNKPYSVHMQVLVIGGKGTNKAAATQIDSMLSGVVEALEDDWDIAESGAPQEVTIKGVSGYLGAVVSLTQHTSIERSM